MNWVTIAIIGFLALAFIVVLVIRNLKDEKQFEENINEDYHKPRNEEGDI
jgi:large-conductance mechanosensitive channel